MKIKDLPNEIQNKIFYNNAEHPICKIFKDTFDIEILKCQEFAIITRKSNLNECFLRIWHADIFLSEQYERKIKAYKMKFVDDWHRRKYIYYGH